MAHIEDAINQLGRAFEGDQPVTLSAEHARTIYNLLVTEPQVLAARLADVAIDAAFAARDCFWSCTENEEAYWHEHRRLVRAVRSVVDIGWVEVLPLESVETSAEAD